MARRVVFEGVTHDFPDDATDAEVAAVLEAASYKPDSPLLHQPNEQETSPEPTMLGGGLHEMLKSAAHPETLGDVASLLLPTGIGIGVNAIGEYAGTLKRAYKTAPTLRKIPQTMFRMLKEDAFPPAVSDADKMLGRTGSAMQTLPATPKPTSRFDPVDAMFQSARDAPSNARGGTTPARPMPAMAAEAEAPIAHGLSAEQRAELVRQHYSPEMIARIEEGLGAAPSTPPMTRGTLRMNPEKPPVTVDEASLPQSWRDRPSPLGPLDTGTVGASWRDTPHPLDPQRVDIGAEKTGRAVGMSKQEVRDVATPILGAEPGAASPILPEGALKNIIDKLKSLPPGGPEREAYVATATSGKAQWQIENIRRTLEHLGLIVPVAATGGAMFRDALIQRLNGGSQ